MANQYKDALPVHYDHIFIQMGKVPFTSSQVVGSDCFGQLEVEVKIGPIACLVNNAGVSTVPCLFNNGGIEVSND